MFPDYELGLGVFWEKEQQKEGTPTTGDKSLPLKLNQTGRLLVVCAAKQKSRIVIFVSCWLGRGK